MWRVNADGAMRVRLHRAGGADGGRSARRYHVQYPRRRAGWPLADEHRNRCDDARSGGRYRGTIASTASAGGVVASRSAADLLQSTHVTDIDVETVDLMTVGSTA